MGLPYPIERRSTIGKLNTPKPISACGGALFFRRAVWLSVPILIFLATILAGSANASSKPDDPRLRSDSQSVLADIASVETEPTYTPEREPVPINPPSNEIFDPLVGSILETPDQSPPQYGQSYRSCNWVSPNSNPSWSVPIENLLCFTYQMIAIYYYRPFSAADLATAAVEGIRAAAVYDSAENPNPIRYLQSSGVTSINSFGCLLPVDVISRRRLGAPLNVFVPVCQELERVTHTYIKQAVVAAVSAMLDSLGHFATTFHSQEATSRFRQALASNSKKVYSDVYNLSDEQNPSGERVGYIYLEDFSEGTDRDFNRHLRILKNQGIDSLVIDLLDNPGGYVQEAINITNEFLRSGLFIRETRMAHGVTDKLYARSGGLAEVAQNLPVALLLNGGSASAAELFASALQYHGRGIIVGQQSFGKATSQQLFDLAPYGSIRITVSQAFNPSGFSYDEVGLAPNVRMVHDPCDWTISPYSGTRCSTEQIRDIVTRSRTELKQANFVGAASERGYYRLGDKVEVQIRADHPIITTSEQSLSSLSIQLEIGNHIRTAPFSHLDTTGNPIFSYRITPADEDRDGVKLIPDSLEGITGTLRSIGGWEVSPRFYPAVPQPVEIFTSATPIYPQRFQFWIPNGSRGSSDGIWLGNVVPQHQQNISVFSYETAGLHHNWFRATSEGDLYFVGPEVSSDRYSGGIGFEIIANYPGGQTSTKVQMLVGAPPALTFGFFPPIRINYGNTQQINLSQLVNLPGAVQWQVYSDNPTQVQAFIPIRSNILEVSSITTEQTIQPTLITLVGNGPAGDQVSGTFTVEVINRVLSALSLPIVPVEVTEQVAVEQFVDDNQSVHQQAINKLSNLGIAHGCNPPLNNRFCPERPVTRGEMASFMVRSLNLPPSVRNLFTDDEGNVHEKNINSLGLAEITRGCNPPQNTHFCPNHGVTRGEMASFLARALVLDRLPGGFADIAHTVHADNIIRIFGAGITQGCNPPLNNRFCPDRLITRAEMATFLVRTLALLQD